MKNISPPVIYYHSVAPAPFESWVQKFLTFDLTYFEDQLAYLQSHYFRAIFFDEWLEFRQGKKKVTGKEVCLAFDDGLLDNWVYVWPLVKIYGMRFTLFVSPECVDPRDIVRPTLEDFWKGDCKEEDLQGLGYLSWKEIKLMQESGYVDVQSHTMTHAKYTASTELDGFYYGGFKGLHPILNADPSIRSNYMNVPDFESRLPLGTPLFQERSAVIARTHTINPEFYREAAALAEKHDLQNPGNRPEYEAAASALHTRFQHAGQLVQSVESTAEYQARLRYEVIESKKVLEEKLEKPVEFLCWPHGDNTPEAHALALESGYLATTAGKLIHEIHAPDRIPRFGTHWELGFWMNRQKLQYKIASHYHRQPYYALWLANEYKNKILQLF
ncbi:MAG: polysaccharide deacetylase family protein [Saprospirales bacterium]|nr:polysaccharide deacetylase family protein [Saprospirales bacterium]